MHLLYFSGSALKAVICKGPAGSTRPDVRDIGSGRMYVPKTTAWLRLDDASRRSLLSGAVREVARRSRVGALLYSTSVAVLALGSSTLRDHPFGTVTVLVLTLVAGVTRSLAAVRLYRQTEPDPLWTYIFRLSTLLTVGPWGVYCASMLYFYDDSWPSTFLLIAAVALAGGAVNSLSPLLLLTGWTIVLILLPTAICGILLGTARSGILGISALIYLVYLMAQLRHTCQTYWDVATARALDVLLSRQAATHSEGRFRTLFEDAPSGIYLAFDDGQIEMANRALAQMLGYTAPEELAGYTLEDFSPDRDLSKARTPLEESGYLAGWESDWLRRDGTRIRVRESVRAVQAGTDQRRRWLGIVQDVTTLFHADQARRQLIEILEGTSDFVERIAVTGETRYMNRATRTLLRVQQPVESAANEEPAAQNPAPPSVWKRSGDETVLNARLRFADKHGVWQGEAWLLAADDTPVPVSQVVISHKLADGSPHSYSIISRNITARRKSEKALRETQEQLFQAQRLESLGRLAGGIAHDFNNLLTIIMAHTSLLEPGLSDPRDREGIAEIGKAADRAAELTRQLLAFGRRQVLSKGVIDVKQVVAGAERMLRRLIGEQIELVTKLSDEPQTVFADAAQLEQVLVNLILNARDAMPHGGVATLETSTVPGVAECKGEEPSPDFIRIAVSDTGIGMDEETMARVFEPFFSTKATGRGTGLGLATAYGFINQSGGTISVASMRGEGTTFSILLPRCSAVPSTLDNQVTPSDLRGTERILVVDDEPALRGLLRQTLAGYGYRVVEARDGEQALALAQHSDETFDLLVTDVVMPGMTGPQLASRLTSAFPSLAVLFISGYPGETEAERAIFGAGAGYLSKPFTAELLLQHVRQQLDRNKGRSASAT